MPFTWCEDREDGQWVDNRVCLHNLEIGKCEGTLGDCTVHKDPIKISEAERKRRADRMRAITRTSRKNRGIGDSDVENKDEAE
jgi:hypothetical protein